MPEEVNVLTDIPFLPQEQNVLTDVPFLPDFGTETVGLPDGTTMEVPMFSSNSEIRRIHLEEVRKQINLYGDFEVGPSLPINAVLLGVRPEGKVEAFGKGLTSFFVGLPTPVLGTPLVALGEEIEVTKGGTAELFRSVGRLEEGKLPPFRVIGPLKADFLELVKKQLRKTSAPSILKDRGQSIIEANQRFLLNIGLFPANKENEFAFMLGGGFGSTGAAMGFLLATRNPHIAAAFFGSLQASAVYKELRDKGIGHETASQQALFAGLFEGAAELFGAHTFLEIAFKPGGALMKGTKGMVVEFIQEATQSGGESAILFDFREDDLITIAKMMGLSGLVGSVVGFSGGVSVGMVQNIMTDVRPDQAQFIKDHPEIAEKFLIEFSDLIESQDVSFEEILADVAEATALEIHVSSSGNISPENKAKVLEILKRFINFEEISTPETQLADEAALVASTIAAARKIQTATEQDILKGRVVRLKEDIAQIDRDTTQVIKDTRAEQERQAELEEDHGPNTAIVKAGLKRIAALEEERIALAFARQELGGELQRAQTEGRGKLTAEDIGADVVTLKEKTEKGRARSALAESLRLIKRGFAKGRVFQKRQTEAIQKAVIDIISASPLTPQEKAGFLRTVKNIRTPEEFEAQLPALQARIEAKVKTRLAKGQETALTKLIRDTVRQTKGGKRAKSRFGPDVQELFKILNSLLRKTIKTKTGKRAQESREVYEQRLKDRMQELLDNLSKEGVVQMQGDMTQEDNITGQLELQLIDILLKKSQAGEANDAVVVAEFLDELLAIKGEGVVERKATLEGIAKNQEDMSEAVLANEALADPDTITDNDIKTTRVQMAISILQNVLGDWNVFRTILKIDQDIRFSLTKAESEHRAGLLGWEASLSKMVDDIFGFKNDKAMVDKMRKDTSTADEDMVINGDYVMDGNRAETLVALGDEIDSLGSAIQEAEEAGKPTDRLEKSLKSHEKALRELRAFKPKTKRIKLNRSQLRKRWMELKDPKQRELVMNPEGMGYTQGLIDDIEAALDEQDLALIEAQLEMYAKMYDRLNTVYKRMYGVNLPRNEFYSRIVRVGDVDTTILDEAKINRGIAFGSLLARVESKAKLQDLNDLETLQRYLYEAEHFVAFGEKIRDLNAVFGTLRDNGRAGLNTPVARAIGASKGKAFLAHVQSKIERFANRGNFMGGAGMKLLEQIRRNFAVSVLGIKVQIGLKQTVSLFAMAEKIPIGDFVVGIKDFLKDPMAAVRILNQDAFIRSRGNKMSVEMADALGLQEFKTYRKKPTLRNYLLLPIRLGDVMPIYMGGWAMYKSLLKQGVSPEGALLQTSAHAEQTQQSTLISNTTPAQDHPIGRLFVMFTSSPTALAKMETIALIKLLQKRKGSGKEFAKAVFIYHFLIPMLFQWVADLFRPTREQYRAMILGPFNAVAILGDILEFGVGQAIGTKTYDYNVFVLDLMHDTFGLMADLGDDEFDMSDFMLDVLELSGELGGLPIETSINIAGGLKTVGEGDITEGTALFLGWPPSVVNERLED